VMHFITWLSTKKGFVSQSPNISKIARDPYVGMSRNNVYVGTYG